MLTYQEERQRRLKLVGEVACAAPNVSVADNMISAVLNVVVRASDDERAAALSWAERRLSVNRKALNMQYSSIVKLVQGGKPIG